MLGRPTDDGDNDPTLEREFFIGGWDPYVVEITRLKRDKSGATRQPPPSERRRQKEDRRKR